MSLDLGHTGKASLAQVRIWLEDEGLDYIANRIQRFGSTADQKKGATKTHYF